MNGKVSLVLHAVLGAAIVYLFVTRPSGNESDAPRSESTHESDSGADKTGGTQLAFYNQDSLFAQYGYVLDEQKVVERRLNAKSQQFEKDYQYFIQQQQLLEQSYSTGKLTEQEVQLQLQEFARQERLLAKQEQDIQQIELDFLKEVNDRIVTFITDYCEEENIDVMFVHSDNLTFMPYRDGLMDLTDAIIAGLNAEYEAELTLDGE